MFNKEQLQRFSIRKLTVGTASVLIGVSILTSWNINKVYADSRNLVSGESTAKNNNPQETGIWGGGNPGLLADSVGKDILVAKKDNAQIVDNGSTEVSESSDSNRSNVIKSDATNRDNVRDKNDNSGTEVPELTAQVNNKQALTTVTEDNGAKVSKIEKYSNSDIKSQFKNFKKTQETTLAMKVLDKEKLSSIKLSEKLDGKIEIPATDPSNYYLSYLNGLIGDNKYIYQVLSLDGDSGSKLILSVNRNDHNDKNIYAYVTDGNYNKVKQSKTIGMDQHSIITINGREYQLNNNGSSEVSIDGNKVSTQNSSTVTSQPLDSDYYYYPYYYPIGQDYGLGNTSNDKCSNIGEIVPVFTKNSVIKYYYSDNEGNLTEIESSPNVSVEGFTGQEFEIKDVDQYKKVIQGYYLTHLPTGNFNGTLSQFSDDKYYKKVYYDFGNNKVKYSVLYHQISPNGTMEVCLFDDKGYPLTESRVIAPNTSTEFSNYYNLTDNVTVRNPYVTAAPHEVQFIYKKLGSIIPVDENGTQIGDAIQFENDTTDPTKASGIVPSISGYTPLYKLVGDQKVPTKVGDQVVNPKDLGENIEVIYSANAQKASVTYIDDKTGKALKVDELNGVTNAKSGYTTKSAIDTYTSLGYTLVSDDTNGAEVVFDNDDKVGQAFTVHLGHGTITVTPEKPGKPGEPINPGEGSVDWPDDTDVKGLTDTVNRTITYVMSDGSTAPDAVDDSLSYTASKVIDKVTGEVMETKWSANQDFKDVDSPSVKGYTPDKTVVSNKNIAHDSDDITEVVTYNADKQKASVTYIDDKTGKALKVDELNGVTNAKSGYTTKSAIDTYTSLGYTLVSDDTNGAEVVFDNDDKVGQAFTVHLGHGTITVTPEKPGKPGEPVDPKNSEGPKYPNGTELDQVKRTGIQTIHYVGAGDKTPADNKQTFIFTREITFDNVTGKIISKTPWNVQSYTFGTVKTPVIPGYHADKAVAGGETVTPDDLNKVITVTYAPDGNPSDHGDTPTPEPTPESEPTPNPTPDDQPDSEISSDEHFENVKAKNKLDKTNPKKVDAYKKQRKIIKTKIAKQGHTEIAEPIEDKVTRENNVKVVLDPVENKAAEPKLPQTGEADNSIIVLLGMLLASFAAMFGFDSLHSHDKKHKN